MQVQPQEPARGWGGQDTAFKPGRKGDSGTGSESGRPQPLAVQGKGATRWHTCTHTCIHMHTHMQDPRGHSHAHTCATDPSTHVHVHVHTHIHAFMHTNTHVQTCKHICRETCEHMHRCVHLHTHTNTKWLSAQSPGQWDGPRAGQAAVPVPVSLTRGCPSSHRLPVTHANYTASRKGNIRGANLAGHKFSGKNRNVNKFPQNWGHHKRSWLKIEADREAEG